ncbi:MAG TPA: hypothetical protein VLX29_08405 [Nitrospirota bacterium]|nr:hypothetical protein [Nitrospirota bacterium]
MKKKARIVAISFICSGAMLVLFACGNSNDNISSSVITLEHGTTEESKIVSTTTQLKNPIIGSWHGGGHSLTFNEDNTYTDDMNQEDKPRVWGKIVLSGNLIMITDIGGSDSCISSVVEQDRGGSYTYNISGNTIAFNLFHDSCSRRIDLLHSPFTK